ncbi:hypothetical protein SKAU_G00132840 [Synaphobranchus kaupii]|uniref:Uncharacterized protein n=1 Tax=Synaphobranchus kaupii TaxID=118154 RepID=A0A9Q1FQX9_SYNKA|nr:hypothetical protein SKAU_G00132840 [Synaphobranchus kaupii]
MLAWKEIFNISVPLFAFSRVYHNTASEAGLRLGKLSAPWTAGSEETSRSEETAGPRTGIPAAQLAALFGRGFPRRNQHSSSSSRPQHNGVGQTHSLCFSPQNAQENSITCSYETKVTLQRFSSQVPKPID